jgi:hypothetical protein
MRAYFTALRQKTVQAVESAMSKSETVRVFGISLYSIKRCARAAPRGEALSFPKGRPTAPESGPERQGLLERDVRERRRQPLIEAGVSWSISRDPTQRPRRSAALEE